MENVNLTFAEKIEAKFQAQKLLSLSEDKLQKQIDDAIQDIDDKVKIALKEIKPWIRDFIFQDNPSYQIVSLLEELRESSYFSKKRIDIINGLSSKIDILVEVTDQLIEVLSFVQKLQGEINIISFTLDEVTKVLSEETLSLQKNKLNFISSTIQNTNISLELIIRNNNKLFQTIKPICA